MENWYSTGWWCSPKSTLTSWLIFNFYRNLFQIEEENLYRVYLCLRLLNQEGKSGNTGYITSNRSSEKRQGWCADYVTSNLMVGGVMFIFANRFKKNQVSLILKAQWQEILGRSSSNVHNNSLLASDWPEALEIRLLIGCFPLSRTSRDGGACRQQDRRVAMTTRATMAAAWASGGKQWWQWWQGGGKVWQHLPTWRSCFAASAEARLAKVTNPTGEAVFPFLLVTFNKEPS